MVMVRGGEEGEGAAALGHDGSDTWEFTSAANDTPQQLYAFWDDDEFACFKPLAMVLKIHAKASLHNQKHLVFLVVMMPDKFTLKLYQLDLLTV